jgi:hypothetical protein
MHTYSENLMERDHLEDLGLDKRIIKFWKELIAYFLLIWQRQQRILLFMCIHCHRNVFTESLPGNDEGPWKAAELLKLVFSLQPNPNSYKEDNSAQDRCHSVQEPETWKTSFRLSEFRGDIQQTRWSQKVVWIHLAQNKDQWWAIVYKVMNFWVSQNTELS